MGALPPCPGSLVRVVPDSPPPHGPVAVRPAATVVLVRDAMEPKGDGDALEVLMVRRNLQSDFVGGAYVFPGGAVDPVDGGSEAEAVCQGRSDLEASALLGLASGGLAYWTAALRETFEEAGLLLAERPGGPPLLAGEPREEARLAAGRAAVNAGRLRFLDLCRNEGLRLTVGDVHYFAHWITPAGATRRYDTRFFVAAAPSGQEATHDAGETIADTWIAPRRALEGHRRGAFDLILPTVRTLQAISRFATSAELLEAAADAARSVPTIEPRLVVDGTGVRIMLPGDEGYEEVGDDRSLGAGTDFNDTIRVVSLAANHDGGVAGGGAVAPRGAL